MARTKKPAGSRANGTTAKAKAKKNHVRPRAANGWLVSFEACHKVLDCVELLEMILLNVYDPQNAFPVVKSSAKDNTQTDREVERDFDQLNLGLDAGDVQGSRIGGRDEEAVYNEIEARRDMKTLLLSQRVNRMFKGTIGGSTKLQRALWYKGIFDNQALSSDKAQWDGAVLRVNPLFTKGWKKPFRFTRFGHDSETGRIRINFTITKKGSEWSNTATAYSAADTDTSASEGPSWRRMLMLQSDPPIQYCTRVSGPDFRGSVYLQHNKLVTAEELQRQATEEALIRLLRYHNENVYDGLYESVDVSSDIDEDLF